MAKTKQQAAALDALRIGLSAAERQFSDLINDEVDFKMTVILRLDLPHIEKIRETILKEIERVDIASAVEGKDLVLPEITELLGRIPIGTASGVFRMKDWRAKLGSLYGFLEGDLEFSKDELRRVIYEAVYKQESLRTVVEEAVQGAVDALRGDRAKARNSSSGTAATTGSTPHATGGTGESGMMDEDRLPPGTRGVNERGDRLGR